MLIIISKAQGRALAKLMARYESEPVHPAATARQLKESLPTLRALYGLSFANPTYGPFWDESPRDDIYWRITKAGREALPSVEVLL